MQSLLRRLAPSPNSEARTNFWLACIPLGVFILARAAIELDTLLAAGRLELDQLDKAITARRQALAGTFEPEPEGHWNVENGSAVFNDKQPRAEPAEPVNDSGYPICTDHGCRLACGPGLHTHDDGATFYTPFLTARPVPAE